MSSMVIPFIGGLAMFIYGMNIMADGLQNAAGSKMKKILEVLTQNKLMGILLGALVTAIIQSSSATTVMVVGCGAVGSFAIEALARTGIGHIIVVDFDTVEESNINRQLFALDSTVGQPKVSVAKNRIYDINPEIHVTALNMFFDDASQIDVMPDFIIDAIDTVESKVALYKWAHAHNVPIISSMGAASKTDISQIKKEYRQLEKKQ